MPLKPETFREILLEIAEGKPITHSLTERQIDNWTFYTFVDELPENRVMYDKAMLIRAEHYASELTYIADTEDNPAKARNRIESRKWLASKINPQRFGERLEINVTKTIDIKAAILEGRQRRLNSQNAEALIPPRDLEKVIDVEPREIIETNSSRNTGQQPDDQPKSNTVAEDKAYDFDDDDFFA